MQQKNRFGSRLDFNKIASKLFAFLPKFAKSFYFIVIVLFLLWMFFFDSNDFITQSQRIQHLKNLEAEKAFYKKEIKNIEQKNQQILNNKTALERFGRENYFLKKSKEDVYIISRKSKEKRLSKSKIAKSPKK